MRDHSTTTGQCPALPSVEAPDPIGFPLVAAIFVPQPAARRPESAETHPGLRLAERTAVDGQPVAFGSGLPE
jgi:hypothetical protein